MDLLLHRLAVIFLPVRSILGCAAALTLAVSAEIPKNAIDLGASLDSPEWIAVGDRFRETKQKFNNVRFRLLATAPVGVTGHFQFGEDPEVRFTADSEGRIELDAAYEAIPGEPRVLRVWRPGSPEEVMRFPASAKQAKAEELDVPLRISAPAGLTIQEAWLQPLDRADHASIISGWNGESLARGQKIYQSLCVVCHGTRDQPGSLPTALRFGEGEFKNGADPHGMWLTLTKGFGQMAAMPQFTTREKYDVIHYIRETYLNPQQRTEINPAYLSNLPKNFSTLGEVVSEPVVPEWLRMDFGPALSWTYQIAPGNIAYKALAIRLDPGHGGVSKGRAWMIYDHDTMRLAAAYTGSGFIDWKSIAFDGSHKTHSSIVGETAFANPVGPGWAHPVTGSWEDPRIRGRDGKPYGPLPREWLRYKGHYHHGDRVVMSYTVGETEILDSPGLVASGEGESFIRTLNLGANNQPLALRLSPHDPALAVSVKGCDTARLVVEGGFDVLRFPPFETPRQLRIYQAKLPVARLEELAEADVSPLDLSSLTKGGPTRFPERVTTEITTNQKDDAAFIVETLTLPDDNPWSSWMRPGGFDFLPDGDRAALCTWNGDLFIVSGLKQSAGKLTWRRIASGLAQPLGLKIHNGDIHVACRDQIAILRDLNGDGEADFIECFNNDHQVTEHFHEFAMGLQTDAAGNFYYAKSGRHALPSIVPQHGTLLRVSDDGKKTDILATGFRAANGVCLNPDGSLFVTDQEGYWMPKNRINHVPPGDVGFFGNKLGYFEEKDPVMREPLAWITNEKDRSPAELLWVPKDQWGPLAGSLLHTSYGTGGLYLVPHETISGRMQGAIIELPLPEFPSGIMRGRFHPSGDLYLSGMVAWATNRLVPGGFYRVRPSGKPSHLPVAMRARVDGIALTFTDPIDPGSVAELKNYEYRTWTLRHTEKYGSDHHDEKSIPILNARLLDERTLLFTPETMGPAQCFRLSYRLRSAAGAPFQGSLDGTIHQLDR